MKKTLKIAGITLGVILLLLLILPFAFQGKLAKLVKEEGNKMLNAQFDFRTLNISLLRNFPSASVSLEDFWLKGTGPFENDTLIQAGELTAAVNLFSFFGDGGYDISRIIVKDTRVHAIVLEDGRPNWDVMKPSPDAETPEDETAQETFRIKLQKLSVDNLSVVYDDRQGGVFADLSRLEADCSGDFGSDRTVVDLKMETPSLTCRTGGIPLLNKVSLEADMDVDADLAGGKFTLRENMLRLNAIQLNLDGWLAQTKQGMDMDLRLNTNEVGFKELLSLIPAIYAKDFQDLKTDGKVTLNAFARGSMEGNTKVPQFEVNLDVKDAMFRYPSLPAGVEKINISALVRNAGGPLDATEISVAPFDFVLAGNPFSLNATVKTPVSDPDFHLTARGKLDLGKVKEVYPLDDMQLNGLVQADLELGGRLSMVEKEQFEQMQAKGSLRLNQMKLVLKDMPPVDIQQSVFTFSPRYLQLSETTVNIGKNDLTLDSRFENYLGYALKGSTLKGTLNVSSNHLNLNDFMSADTTAAVAEVPADTAAMGVIRVPENIDFQMQAAFRELLFDKMTLTDGKGTLLVRNGTVDMRNLSFNTMGGSVTMNGAYAAPQNKQPELNAAFNMRNISFAQAYQDLGLVQQLAPIFAGLKGNFSGNLQIDTPLDATMSPVMSAVQGKGALSTKDLSLSGVKFIDQVADIVKKPSLKEIKVKDLNIDFEIKDGRVTTKPFDLKLGDYNMNLSGSTGLDQTIDYTGKITMPADGIASKLGTVDMTIGGTFTSPKVGIDMASLARNAAEQALKGLGEKLGNDSKGSEKKKSVINKALDLFKKKK
ncbi:AsmA family protein [Phocaeicola coprophilus]|uniref:AsmA family protein n=1 Tax=Phocaeicola coprophilus TaxID=387090 RepID=A0A413T4W6_9BACT|nr:AsmA family protein [Phocaeicola coprophilus]QRO26543.1 AsmA family protein [Phocaeicola coprophilus]RHA78716.1 AsmA family protein [Phocaeicola coprophilus]